ncbi:putative uncharacterized protein C6orf52 homolog [Choloepus didactylus]|uniref:putative uncharacterized protein C6orf52 homolog n=1 Tax=Choloepus didactylus TaxID=27675 RepID=UPI00189D477D|nr:putative uncharacterized protein C6orf52 homolog [Choloepus didactylus]
MPKEKGPSCVGAQIIRHDHGAALQAPASVKKVSVLRDQAEVARGEEGTTPHQEGPIAKTEKLGVKLEIQPRQNCPSANWYEQQLSNGYPLPGYSYGRAANGSGHSLLSVGDTPGHPAEASVESQGTTALPENQDEDPLEGLIHPPASAWETTFPDRLRSARSPGAGFLLSMIAGDPASGKPSSFAYETPVVDLGKFRKGTQCLVLFLGAVFNPTAHPPSIHSIPLSLLPSRFPPGTQPF